MKQKIRSWFIVDDEAPKSETANTPSDSKDKKSKEQTFIPVLINSSLLGIGIHIGIFIISFLLFELDVSEWGKTVAAGQMILMGLIYILYVFIIIKSIVDYKKDNEGYISFGRAFFISYLSVLTMSLFTIVLVFIVAHLTDNNIGREETGALRFMFSAGFPVLASLFFSTFFGIFACIFFSAVLHKKKPVPFRSK